VSGLEVTKIGPLKLRMAPGRAVCGGYILVVTEELIYNVPPNLTGAARISRWVLERSVIGDIVSVEPEILDGGPPIGPSMTQFGLPGIWQIPVARWAVVPGTNEVQFLTNDGPGAGLAMWARDAYTFPSNIDTGVPDLYGYRLPQYGRGPEPASVDGMNFTITQAGIYTIDYSIYLREAETALQAEVKPFIRLHLPGEGDVVEPIKLGGTGPSQHGRARIVEPVAVNADDLPFTFEPRLYQNTGASQAIDFKIKIARGAA
jgi:hypothetical protein